MTTAVSPGTRVMAFAPEDLARTTPAIFFTRWITHVCARYGSAPFLFLPPPTLGTPRDVFPPEYGWELWVTYALWAVVVAVRAPT